MINKKYIELVQDIVENNYIAPVKTIKNKENWICYCGETWPTHELKGIVKNLLSNQITEVIVITFNTMDNISIKTIDNLTYEKLDSYYHGDYYNSEVDTKSVVLTTKKIDFICYKDEENICFSVCGDKALVNDAFMNREYEKMKRVFMKKAKMFAGDYPPLYKYWINFFNTYDSINNK